MTISTAANKEPEQENTIKVIISSVGGWFSKAGKTMANWAGGAWDAISGLFNKVGKAEEEIDKAQREGDNNKAEELAKECLKNDVGAANVDEMSGEEAIAFVEKIDDIHEKMDAAIVAVNRGEFTKLKVELENILAELKGVKEKAKIPEQAQFKITAAVKVSNEGTNFFVEKIKIEVEDINKQGRSPESEKKINELNNQLVAITMPDRSIKESLLALQISAEAIAGIDENIGKAGEVAAEIIQVAAVKGYKLDNFAQLASIAGVGSGDAVESDEEIGVVDGAQLARNFHPISNDLTEKVVTMLRENREEQDRLDNKAYEKKELEVQMENKQDEKQYLVKIAEKRRQLGKLQKQLEQIIKPDLAEQEKINNIIGQIIENINKPTPLT